MRLLLTAALVLAYVGPATAATDWKMNCRNPRQTYELVFNPAARTLTLNPDTDKTAYRVLAIEGSDVVGMVGHDSGLGFDADFAGFTVTFYSDDKAVQTDSCADTGL